MELQFNSVTEKYDWLIKNWSKMSNAQLAEAMGTTENTVAQMARKARQNGHTLIRKNTRKWKRSTAVDWKSIKKSK